MPLKETIPIFSSHSEKSFFVLPLFWTSLLIKVLWTNKIQFYLLEQQKVNPTSNSFLPLWWVKSTYRSVQLPELVHGVETRASHLQEGKKGGRKTSFIRSNKLLKMAEVHGLGYGHEILAWDNIRTFPFSSSFTQLFQTSNKHIKTCEHTSSLFVSLYLPKLSIKHTHSPMCPSSFKNKVIKDELSHSLCSMTHKARQSYHSSTLDIIKKKRKKKIPNQKTEKWKK